MVKGLKLKKILVTGADGFIGSHMVERLVLNDFTVKALTQYNSFNSWGWLENLPSQIINELEIVPGDVRDSFFVNKLVKDCSHVIHLAALIAIPYSYKSTLSYIETNIIGTHLENDFIDSLKANQNLHAGLKTKLPKEIKVFKFEKFDELLKSDVDLIVLGISSKGIEWVANQLSRVFKNKQIPKIRCLW